MRTILDGPVTEAMLDTAGMFGIEPTSFLVDGQDELPVTFLDVTVVWTPEHVTRYGLESAKRINAYKITRGAQAVICKGRNEQLLRLADLMGIPAYQED